MKTRSSQWLIITACCLFALAKAQYDYTGGVPLRVPAGECPSGTVNGSITLNQNCCPEGQTYVYHEASTGGSVCCPNESDCYETVHVAQKCADPAWALCDTGTIETELGFCCQSGWTCFAQVATSSVGAGVGCSAPGSSLLSYQSVVATIYKADEGPGVTTSSSTSSSSTSTSTSQSTTSSSSTSTITAAPSATTSTIAATSSSSSSSSSGISGGAIAGIVVGAVAAIVALVGGAYMYGKRRRDRQGRYGANMAEVTRVH